MHLSKGVTAFTIALAAHASVTAAAEPAGDACKLLSASQVTGVLGVPVTDGAYRMPGHTQYCIWREQGKPEALAQNVQVNFLSVREYDLLKTGTFAKGAETGIGDEAYWTNAPGIGFILSIKKGGTYLRVQSRPIPEGMARRSDTPADKAKWEDKERTVEKAIAALVLKQL